MKDELGYKRLIIWQKADELALLIYQITKSFPKSELFGLTSQIRRAALSVATNIVEGYARNGKAEFRRFIVISLGSLAEFKYLLTFSYKLKFINTSDFNETLRLAEETNKVLWSFYKSL